MWTKEQVIVLIDNYKRYPCLYAVKSKLYSNKHARMTALENICLEVSSVRNGTSISDIKTKFNSLRTSFLHEYRRVAASRKSGAGEEDVYEPTLWYYDKMLFIKDHYTARNSTDSISWLHEEMDTEGQIQYVEGEEQSSDVNLLSPNISQPSDDQDKGAQGNDLQEEYLEVFDNQFDSQSQVYTSPPTPQTFRKKTKKANKTEDVLATANETLADISNVIRLTNQQDANKLIQPAKCREDSFGEFVASRLKLLDAKEKNKKENEIIQILFQ